MNKKIFLNLMATSLLFVACSGVSSQQSLNKSSLEETSSYLDTEEQISEVNLYGELELIFLNSNPTK